MRDLIALGRAAFGRAAFGRTTVVFGLLALVTLAHAQPASVRARLAANTISIDESVSLVVEASGLDGELDISALERDFDIVGRSSSRDVSILNGERRSTVTWVLELVPRAVGVFTVPPVTVGGVESELLSLTVTEAPSGGERLVFVEAEIDTDTPWVQSQVVLTLRVLRAIDILDGALGEPGGEGLDVRTLGDDRRYTERRDGRDYIVVERRFALFPQRSGALSIAPITLSVTVPSDPSRTRGLFAPTRKITRRTAAIPLTVRARPPDVGGWWLPASGVSIDESWSGGVVRAGGDGALEARVGEPLTRTVRLGASGVLSTQLPDIGLPAVNGLSLYADDPVREDGVEQDGVRAVQTLSLAVIPEREGTFELPPVRVDWFDVEREETRTALLPGRSITVLPGAMGAGVAEPIDPAASTGPPVIAPGPDSEVAAVAGDGADRAGADRWRPIAIGALLGWALTALGAVWAWRARPSFASRTRRRDERTDTVDASVRAAKRRLRETAGDSDLGAFADALLARAAVRWPNAPPRSLVVLARRLDRASDLVAPLHALDAALFGASRAPGDSSPAVDREALLAMAERVEQALADTPDQAHEAGTTSLRGALPPL